MSTATGTVTRSPTAARNCVDVGPATTLWPTAGTATSSDALKKSATPAHTRPIRLIRESTLPRRAPQEDLRRQLELRLEIPERHGGRDLLHVQRQVVAVVGLLYVECAGVQREIRQPRRRDAGELDLPDAEGRVRHAQAVVDLGFGAVSQAGGVEREEAGVAPDLGLRLRPKLHADEHLN